MTALALVLIATDKTTEHCFTPENDRPPIEVSLRSPLEIREFLRLRMADCLPRIGEIGRQLSRNTGVVVPMQSKPVRCDNLQTLALAEVVNC
jgi:hypothetical protein